MFSRANGCCSARSLSLHLPSPWTLWPAIATCCPSSWRDETSAARSNSTKRSWRARTANSSFAFASSTDSRHTSCWHCLASPPRAARILASILALANSSSVVSSRCLASSARSPTVAHEQSLSIRALISSALSATRRQAVDGDEVLSPLTSWCSWWPIPRASCAQCAMALCSRKVLRT